MSYEFESFCELQDIHKVLDRMKLLLEGIAVSLTNPPCSKPDPSEDSSSSYQSVNESEDDGSPDWCGMPPDKAPCTNWTAADGCHKCKYYIPTDGLGGF